MPTTTNYGFYSPPLTGVTPDVPRDTKTLADAVDAQIKSEENARIAGDARLIGSRGHAANTSIASGTWTSIPFDTMENDEIPWDGTNIRFNVASAGYYIINSAVVFASNATGVRGIRIVQTAGATQIATMFAQVNAATFNGVQISRSVKLTAADNFAVQCYQSSGAALTLNPAGRGVYVDIVRVG